MNKSDLTDAAVSSITAATASKAAVVPATTAAVLADHALLFLGVPLNVFLLAFTGSLVGLSMKEKEADRRPVYGLISMYTLIGAYGSAGLPHVPGLSFLEKMPQTALAVILAVAMHWVFPVLTKELPDMVRRVFRRIAPHSGGKDSEG